MAEQVTYPEDPRRCQAVTANGQCPSISTNGTPYCLAHGGIKNKSKGLRNYALTKWRAKVERQVDSPHIKSLRDEVGILRTLLEERLETVKDSHDLILQTGPISDLIIRIEKLVVSCNKLEGALGETLDKAAVLNFAGIVISILQEELTDSSQLNIIADRIMGSFSESQITKSSS